MSLRLFNGFRVLCEKLEDSEALETFVESLAFKHLAIDVTQPRIDAVCDSIVDLVEQHAELPGSGELWQKLLSYAGNTYTSVCPAMDLRNLCSYEISIEYIYTCIYV